MLVTCKALLQILAFFVRIVYYFYMLMDPDLCHSLPAAESDASRLSSPSHRHTRHHKRRSPPPPQQQQQQVSEEEEEEGCGSLDDGNVRDPHGMLMGSQGMARLRNFRSYDQ